MIQAPSQIFRTLGVGQTLLGEKQVIGREDNDINSGYYFPVAITLGSACYLMEPLELI